MTDLLLPVLLATQAGLFPLTDLKGLKSINVKSEVVTFKGHQALRVTDAVPGEETGRRLVVLPGTEMADGTIELEVAGDILPNSHEEARGFVGLAFRVTPDAAKFESIYLRPTNGRADDQIRRNHSVQYNAIPDFPWFKLRKEFPEKYETYVDLVPGEWTKMRIDFSGTQARLFVHDAKQPTLIVNDLKLGAGRGAIGLWIGVGTVAHFANLRITKEK